MKKIFILVLAMFSIVSYAAIEVVDGIEWNYEIIDNSAQITKTKISGDVEIPSRLGGAPVKIIGRGAFCNCKDLTSLTIPK